MNQQREQILKQIEALDEDIRINGLSAELKAKWSVTTNVGTWSIGRKTGEWLHAKVLEQAPTTIVEIGTSVGCSAIWLGDAAEQIGATVITVEKERYKFDEAHENITKAGLEKTVDQIHADALDWSSNWSKPIDFLFLDANKKGYLPVLKNLEKHLAPGAIVIADNCIDMAKELKEYIEYMQTSRKFETQLVEIDHGLLVSIRTPAEFVL